jgi:hypothetical protein
LTKSERSAFRALVGAQKAAARPISPDGAADYVRLRSRLKVLQRLLNDAVRADDGSWPSQTRVLQLVRAIDAATALAARLRKTLRLQGTE